MNRNILIIITLAFLAGFTSCKKAPLTIGKVVTHSRQLGHFDTLVIMDDINVLLIKSGENKVEITAGENIMDNILTRISDSTLVIGNDNKLSWIRTYDYRIDVKLYFKNICHLTHSSSGTLKTANQFNSDTTYTPFQGDTLYFHPYYEIFVDGSSGDIDMEFNNCDRLFVDYKYGTGKIRIHGGNNHFLDVYKKSYGNFDALDYESEHVDIHSRSTGDCWINASKYIKARIDKTGNVYYKGDPENTYEIYDPNARGRLIKLESEK